MYNKYTVHFYRADDDEYEQGTDIENIQQLTREIQEAMDQGHCPATFHVVHVEKDTDAPFSQEGFDQAAKEFKATL